MFATLSKYSPKQLLAPYLSKTLAEYFYVDPSNVETNLVNDAKIVLHHVQVRPQILQDQYNAPQVAPSAVHLSAGPRAHGSIPEKNSCQSRTGASLPQAAMNAQPRRSQNSTCSSDATDDARAASDGRG